MSKTARIEAADNGFTIELFDGDEFGGKVKRLIAKDLKDIDKEVSGFLGISAFGRDEDLLPSTPLTERT